jgi:hypothetical protein
VAALLIATVALLVSLGTLVLPLRQLLDSFWREIEIGACAWWEG